MDAEEITSIGGRIAEARQKAHLSQADLADALKVHVDTIANYEKGRRKPFEAISDIAAATHVSVRWLLFGKEYEDRLDKIEEAIRELASRLPAPAEVIEQALDAAVARDEKTAQDSDASSGNRRPRAAKPQGRR
ncbi:MAG TPA: helix-turn-helix domain-containing protein [Solirubrobacteraceae bacterium]|jgi:transcriptional regulator with XRE-family HTH domain